MSELAGFDPRQPKAVELVEMIRHGGFSDERCAELIEELQRLLPHPAWTDLMFYREPPLSDEGVVQEALSYRPIEL
ncbi:hypothetical protein AB0D08_21800 [Kitasatospora sp. NPDC048540]|uniref:hypothetical protein n=1 Tax=Kitasatospora sp. NPDC048540 TaxID=3155634 RepID=UPI0033C301E9